MVSFPPPNPKKGLRDPLNAFGGKLSRDTPQWTRMCVKSILQWHIVDLECLRNKIMTVFTSRWAKLNNICSCPSLCRHSLRQEYFSIFCLPAGSGLRHGASGTNNLTIDTHTAPHTSGIKKGWLDKAIKEVSKQILGALVIKMSSLNTPPNPLHYCLLW